MNIKYQHILTKKFLIKEYIKNKKSIRQIARQVGCSGYAINYNLNKYKILLRSSLEGRQLQCKDFPKNFSCKDCGDKICYCSFYYGQGRCRSCSSKLRMKLREINGTNNSFFGKHHTETTKEKIRNSDYHKNLAMENNSQWIDGRSFEPYPINWTDTYREQIRNRDNHECQFCGCLENGRKLCVHHIDYNKENLNPENLISLCINCHLKTNFNRKQWKNYFKINKQSQR